MSTVIDDTKVWVKEEDNDAHLLPVSLYMKREESEDRTSVKDEDLYLDRPKKRRRVIFDGVVVPTLAAVRQREAEEVKEDYKKLALLKNAKIKKNTNLALLPQTLRDRLKPIGLDIQDQYFTLDQASREVLVLRAFISSVYGGSPRMALPKLSKRHLEEHGMDDWMFMIPTEYQPEAPQLPGAPGLRLSLHNGRVFEKPMRVMVRMDLLEGPSSGALYQYMGMYQVVAANLPCLSVEEY